MTPLKLPDKDFLKKLPLGFLMLLGLFIAALYISGSIIHDVFFEQEVAFDVAVFRFISDHFENASLLALMKVITHLASAWFLRAGYSILVLIYLFRRNLRRAIEVFVIGVGGYLMNYQLKLVFQRPRPDGALIDGITTFAFPSGHASDAMIFYGLIAYLIFKTTLPAVYKYLLITISLCIALLIGFSRIYLRVHYPTDVLAGFCTGFAWLLGCMWLFRHLRGTS